MKKLAKREEQIMQVLWDLEKAFVKEIVEKLPEPKPHYNTVSTIIQVLKKKGFVDHKSYGNTHQYFPLIAKEIYQKEAVGDVISKYFDNSYSKMVAYFAKEEKISEDELKDILDMIKKK
ncbi:MAG: BlaI family penicillinase repressor [Paraglaciecola sp.]|jgi:BlaI family penicillinase repressor